MLPEAHALPGLAGGVPSEANVEERDDGQNSSRGRVAGDCSFHIEDSLWAQVIYDFACTHQRKPLERGHPLRSLTPLYLARVTSFVIETKEMFAAQVEDRIEQLCLTFENVRPYLAACWRGMDLPNLRKLSRPASPRRASDQA